MTVLLWLGVVLISGLHLFKTITEAICAVDARRQRDWPLAVMFGITSGLALVMCVLGVPFLLDPASRNDLWAIIAVVLALRYAIQEFLARRIRREEAAANRQ